MTINFNKKLYKLASIKMAVKAFDELADFFLEKKDNHYSVKIKNAKDYSLSAIKDEFCNYVLYIMKSKI